MEDVVMRPAAAAPGGQNLIIDDFAPKAIFVEDVPIIG